MFVDSIVAINVGLGVSVGVAVIEILVWGMFVGSGNEVAVDGIVLCAHETSNVH